MSYIFDVDNETVWSPALRVGDLYVRFLREVAGAIGEPTGLTPLASDMYDIEVNVYGVLIRKMVDVYFSSGSIVLRRLIEGVLLPSVVILERAGHPLSPQSEEERDLIDRARSLPMAR